MSNFLNLSPHHSKCLHAPIFKNALKLKKDAITLAECNASYSTANSLLILSSEEVIKAILVLLHSEGYHVYRIEGAKKFFTDHKIRHELAKLIEVIKAILESSNALAREIHDTNSTSKNQFWMNLLNGIHKVLSVIGPIAISAQRINELEQFNDYKNRGFYVDFDQEIRIPENQFNSSSFQKNSEIVARIFKTYSILQLLHSPQFLKRAGNQEIKESMRSKINEELKNFSIKEIL